MFQEPAFGGAEVSISLYNQCYFAIYISSGGATEFTLFPLVLIQKQLLNKI